MVYVVGLDEVAKKEDSPKARNELFVALTRSRAWAHVSGTDTYPFYEEFQKVFKAATPLPFLSNSPLRTHSTETNPNKILPLFSQN